MGLDLDQQALPADCRLLELARTDSEIAEKLQFLPGLLRSIYADAARAGYGVLVILW